MIKLVIFDMDGLMFDTENVNYRAYTEVLQEKGLPSSREEYLHCLGMNSQDLINRYREVFGDAVDARKLYREVGIRAGEIIKREGVPVKEGLRELLLALADEGILKAVASGSDKKVIEENLEGAGISEAYDMVMSSSEVKRGKPHPDIFLEICRRFEVEPGETLVLEDSSNGVRAALAGKIPVINIPDMQEIPAKEQKECVAVVKSLRDVIPYIRGEA